MARYEFLDSLRGIAILGVVMTHVGQTVVGGPEAMTAFARFGLRGVQLFFIVSALTLCLVTDPKTLQPARFYIRRYFRIAPMFYVAAAFYLLSSRLFGIEFSPNRATWIDISSTFLFVHGFNPHGINDVVPGGWSIASEAIFYAIFPLVIPCAAGRRRWLGITIFTVFLALVNNAIPRLAGLHDTVWRDFFHFNFISNLPAFSMGILLFTILRADAGRRLATPVVAVGIALIAVACIAIGCASAKMAGDQILMVPVLGSLVWIAAVARPAILVNDFLSFLGEISFSIYLVHFAVLRALGDLAWTGMTPSIRLVALYLLTVSASSSVAWVSYRLIERPMTKVGHRISGRVRRLAAEDADLAAAGQRGLERVKGIEPSS